MKLTCPISGVAYEATLGFGSAYAVHPTFALPQRSLETAFAMWDKLADSNKVILTLAWLNCSGLYEFSAPLKQPKYEELCMLEEHRELLASVVPAMQYYSQRVAVPRFHICEGNNTISGIINTLSVWEDWLVMREQAKADNAAQREIRQLSQRVEFMIRTPLRKVSHGKALAQWAAKAMRWPEPLISYWTSVVVDAVNGQSLLGHKTADLEELLEHCESYAMIGSLPYEELTHKLRDALQDRKDFLKGTGKYSLTSDSLLEDREEVALRKLQNDAPTVRPVRKDYADQFSYIRDLVLFTQAEKLRNAAPATTGSEEL